MHSLAETGHFRKEHDSRVLCTKVLPTFQLLTHEQIVEELFLATLSRYPDDREKRSALEHVNGKPNRQGAFVDMLWALINTREFILKH